jgi:hypothetical protein
MEKWKFLTPPGLELRTFVRPSSSQSLYRLRYSVSLYVFTWVSGSLIIPSGPVCRLWSSTRDTAKSRSKDSCLYRRVCVTGTQFVLLTFVYPSLRTKQERFELLVPTLMPPETVNSLLHAAVYIDLGQFNWTICLQCNLPVRRNCLQSGNCILVLPVTITETLEPWYPHMLTVTYFGVC